MANPFMCSIEEKLAHENKLLDFYRRYIEGIQDRIEPIDSPIQIMLPFRDQKSADRQLCDLGKKIDRALQKVFTSRKSQMIQKSWNKSPTNNQQRIVYEFKRNSCDANYIG